MKHITLLIILCSFSFFLFAQERVITGKVAVFNKLTLANIKVESKKTDSSTLTDSLGFYQIVCAPKDIITFSGKTFSKKRVKVKPDDKVIDVNMRFLSNPKNVDMAVGYGYISKEDATTAYTNLTSNDVDFCSYNDIFDLIAGKCAGVSVGNTSSMPGAEQEISIRGINSMNQSNPLYIVDGTRTTQIAHITPCDVKSISFLKDSEAAIYGASGGGGVILIETKTGNEE